jgi:hypothetical protein
MVAAGLTAAALAAGPASAAPAPPEKKDRPRDCTTQSSLSGSDRSTVKYVVWCGVQTGRVTLRIRRPNDPRPLGFERRPEVSGSGASGAFECRRQRGGRVFCEGRKKGSITVRGTVTVPPGSRCATAIKLNVWRWTGDTTSKPVGCKNAYLPQVRPIREIIRNRAEDGLDLDLAGDRKAIVRRAMRLQRAWFRGNPVARWTSEEEAWGMPLYAHEQVELEYRDEYRERFQDLVEEGDWIAKNAPTSYAGYELDFAAGGIIYVGFTVEPEATLEKLKTLLIAPDRFKPFPVPPRYTEDELEDFQEALWPSQEPLSRLINMSSIDYLANEIEVGTQHVARVKRLITERYGPDAPFKVVFARPAVLL